MQFNPLLRDIFGLGPPLILDATTKTNKISRFEKVETITPLFSSLFYHENKCFTGFLFPIFLKQHLFNSAAFKARTKQRNKVRDKRADVMWGDGKLVTLHTDGYNTMPSTLHHTHTHKDSTKRVFGARDIIADGKVLYLTWKIRMGPSLVLDGGFFFFLGYSAQIAAVFLQASWVFFNSNFWCFCFLDGALKIWSLVKTSGSISSAPYLFP